MRREGRWEDFVKRRKRIFVVAAKLAFVFRQKRILWVAFWRWVDVRGGRVAFRRRTFPSQADLQVLLPNFMAEGGDGFGADAGNGLEQKLGDITEGDGVFARDVMFREKAKDFAEGAVHSRGGGEVSGERYEFGGQIEFALGEKGENFLLASGMEEAKVGVMIGAQHAALPLIGREKATARRFGRGGESFSVILVQERIDMGSGTRRRRDGAVERSLCGGHMQCYRGGKSGSMVLVLSLRNGLWKRRR